MRALQGQVAFSEMPSLQVSRSNPEPHTGEASTLPLSYSPSPISSFYAYLRDKLTCSIELSIDSFSTKDESFERRNSFIRV